MRISFRAALTLFGALLCFDWMASVASAQAMPMAMPTMMPTMMINPFLGGGILVDADGVLRTQMNPDVNGHLTRQRMAAARAALDPKLVQKSPLRKVSLNRLEAAVKSRGDMGMKPTEDMQFLAGMTRITHVFFYPETNDIVIAGPAEGYVTDMLGRTRGIETGSATLMLDDMVVALRAFFKPEDNKNNVPLISVSIDPTKEGLASMQQFLNQVGSRATPNNTEFITKGLKESLGLQSVRLTGVPGKSHFAQVLVEADYRMKLIGIGLEPTPIKGMQSYAARANPAAIARNALARWYFVPNYQCVRVAEDDLAMEMVGDGVKLLGADEMVKGDGSRSKTTSIDLASKGFTTDFTKNYAQIAASSPVFAQLRNVIDMAVVAAFIKDKDYAETAGWKMNTFLKEEEYAVETLNVPKQVETAVAAFWKGNRLVTPIGGGIRIEPTEALQTANVLADKDGKVAKQREAIDLKNLAPNQWWWD